MGKIKKKLIVSIALASVVALAISWFIYKNAYSNVAAMLLTMSVLFVCAGLISLWIHRNNSDIRKGWDIAVIISENEISFPEGYYFRASNINRNNKISAASINEINLNTLPASLVFEGREVIFVKYDQDAELKHFSERNNIPIVERLDIWSCITKPYLDTEFSTEYHEQILSSLESNGVSREEAAVIRKKISSTMWLNVFAWDWLYLGQYDYLKWTTFLTKKKYWWTMDLALRNFKKNAN